MKDVERMSPEEQEAHTDRATTVVLLLALAVSAIGLFQCLPTYASDKYEMRFDLTSMGVNVDSSSLVGKLSS